MQELILIILVAAAIVYMGRRFYKQYKAEAGCASGCDSCAPSKKDFELPGHLKG